MMRESHDEIGENTPLVDIHRIVRGVPAKDDFKHDEWLKITEWLKEQDPLISINVG
jgi:hypothetical protein